jgi:hypothetical protein
MNRSSRNIRPNGRISLALIFGTILCFVSGWLAVQHATQAYALDMPRPSDGIMEAAHNPDAGTAKGVDGQARSVTSSSATRPNTRMLLAQSSARSKSRGKSDDTEKVWRSEELHILGIGLGLGDVDGDGKNDVVIIDPSTVYLYRFEGSKLTLVTQYSPSALELKTVDVAQTRKQGPARIYVSAQNRGAVASFVLEYRKGDLVPVVQDFPYFLRVVDYPTHGPILLGQQKGMRRMYDGPILRIIDKGDDLEVGPRFGTPMKIPIFGFTVGDYAGNLKPLIAVYDRGDHLRIYDPAGKRLYMSKDYFGGSDILLRWTGPEEKMTPDIMDSQEAQVFFRPRIMSFRIDDKPAYEILAIAHESKTMRLLGRTKMLEEGQVIGLTWNGDSLERTWNTPKIQGMITDFAIGTLPGMTGTKLITLERKKTDWLAFLRSRSQLRAYDLQALVKEGVKGESPPVD